MKLQVPVSLLFVCCCICAKAQVVAVEILLKTNGKENVGNARVRLYSLPDTILLQSNPVADNRTVFSVHPFSRYLIKASVPGFDEKQLPITLNAQPLSVVLELDKTAAVLKEVTVVSKKKFMQQEDDKTIVDAEPLAGSSTNAYEVLEKTPGAVVDQDGNVYLNSTTPAAVYINGREMKMSTEDIASLLKSLPAGSVSKIEILRTPSAKYDAASSGGIVNVVLKKGIKIGSTGTAMFRVDQGVYYTASAGLSINKTAGKINSYLSWQYTGRNYYEDIQSERLVVRDTLLLQKSSTRYAPITNYAGGGIDIAFTKRFNLAFDTRITAVRNRSEASSANVFRDLSHQQDFMKSNTPISNNGHSLFAANTLGSKYKIDSVGSEWTNQADYTYSDNKNQQGYSNNYSLPASPSLVGEGHVQTSATVINFQSDLSLKLKYQLLLETGFKSGNARNANEAFYFTSLGNAPKEVDQWQTRTFRYRENIHSAYLQVTRSFRGILVKTGLRFENTNIRGNQFIPADTSFSIHRNDLFPYLFIKRYLFKIFGYPLNGNIIFRRSITRPAYDALNPAPRFVDPFTYDIGNPKLQPQFTTNYELNATYNDFPVFAIGVNDTRDLFSRVTYQDAMSRVAYRTFDNLGKNKEIYGRLFGGLPSGHKYFMYAGVQYNYLKYRGTYQGLPLYYNRGSWTFFTGHDLKLTSSLRFNVNAWMYVRGFRAFNELKNMGQLNASVTKTFFDRKLSIVASASDILKTNISRFHIQQGTVIANGSREQDSRRVGITVRYNFGIVRKEEKKPGFNQQPVEPLDAN